MFITDQLFPKLCVSCSKKGGYVCGQCIENVSLSETICPSCNRFSFYGKTHDQCLLATSLNGLICLWQYSGIIKKSLLAAKYRFALEVIKDLHPYVQKEVKKFILPNNSAFVSVPLHQTRNNWRGFNQAEELAKNLSVELGYPLIGDVLRRKKVTTPQVSLEKLKRLRNMRGKIAVNTTILDKIDKKTVIYIVDDVWTTGATLKECAKVLKEAGVKNVWGLTIARAYRSESKRKYG